MFANYMSNCKVQHFNLKPQATEKEDSLFKS